MFRKIFSLLVVFTLHLTLYTYTSAAGIAARINLVSGPVEIKIGSEAVWKKAEKDLTLNEKDEIRTGAGGRVVLLLSNGGRISLQENSNLSLNELQEDSVQVAMNAGTMNVKVKKMGATGKFQVGTPASVCAVRGTSFKVKTNEKETEVECYRGSVNVRKSGALEETMLSRWEKILVSQEQPLSSPITMSRQEKNIVLAPVKTEMNQEVRMGMSREAVQAAAAQEIKKAEYQQGKSLIDAFGYRVRLEEYIVRPQADQFKMVVLNERENRFDYFTWVAAFKNGSNDQAAVLPTDLTQATKWISWDSGSIKPDYYLSSNETAASNTVDSVEYGYTGGHIVDKNQTVSGKYEHLYDNYNFKINNNPKISYEPKSGTGIKNIVTDINFKISGQWVGTLVSINAADLTNFVNDYNNLYNPDITSSDAQNYWEFLTWWNTNVTPTKSDSSEVWDNRLQADFGSSLYNEDYYLIDDNGKKASLDEMNKIYDSSDGKYVKSELLKWNQELVMSGDDFNGPDKKIDLVVEPKIFIDAGIIPASKIK